MSTKRPHQNNNNNNNALFIKRTFQGAQMRCTMYINNIRKENRYISKML
jgi:hypothetical protein